MIQGVLRIDDRLAGLVDTISRIHDWLHQFIQYRRHRIIGRLRNLSLLLGHGIILRCSFSPPLVGFQTAISLEVVIGGAVVVSELELDQRL